MKKIVKWTLVGVLLLVIAGAVVVWVTLDSIVRKTVEKQATASLQTQTTLNGASVSPFAGKVSLSGLAIANPPGFAPEPIFKLDDASVAVAYSELRQDPVRIESISLKEPTLTIELKDLKTNIQALMNNLPQTDPAPADQSKPLHLIISKLSIENPTVILRPSLPGLSQEIPLKLPSLQMADIGTGEGNKNGAAIKDVVMLVVTQLASKAADSDQIPPELKQLLNLNVAELTAQLKSKLNVEVEKVAGDLSRKIGGQLGETVGDLVKNPNAATTNPSQAIEQGVGAFLKDQMEKKSKKK